MKYITEEQLIHNFIIEKTTYGDSAHSDQNLCYQRMKKLQRLNLK